VNMGVVMRSFLVYWRWPNGGEPAPTLVEARDEEDAKYRARALWKGQSMGREIYQVTETDVSQWPVCDCGGWFVSDLHAHSCPAFGNTEGTWIVPTRPQGTVNSLSFEAKS